MFESFPSVLHLPGEVSPYLFLTDQILFRPFRKHEKRRHCSGIRARPAVACAATHPRKATSRKAEKSEGATSCASCSVK